MNEAGRCKTNINMDNLKFNVLHTEWSDGWGGQEIRILSETVELLKRGHSVKILCPPESGLAKNAPREGVSTILMKIKHILDIQSLWKIKKLIQEENFQVVNTHSSVDSWVASFAAKWAKVPVLVRTRHLSVPVSTHPLNFVYKIPDIIITTGESIRNQLIDRNKLNPNQVISIPTGVDLNNFSSKIVAPHLRSELGLNEGCPVITMVAVLRSWKRHDIFLEAARSILAHYPRARFLVVGEGPARPRIHEKIKELYLEEKVLITGHREDIPEILSITDVAVLTSESYEGVPQAVLQYLAMERPVIATDVGSISEVIKDRETGILVPPNSARNVAEGILRLLNDKELGRRLGKDGRKLVEKKFNNQAMMEATLRLYYHLYNVKIAQRS